MLMWWLPLSTVVGRGLRGCGTRYGTRMLLLLCPVVFLLWSGSLTPFWLGYYCGRTKPSTCCPSVAALEALHTP